MKLRIITAVLALSAVAAAAQTPVTKASVPGIVNFSKVETTVACAGATTPALLPSPGKRDHGHARPLVANGASLRAASRV